MMKKNYILFVLYLSFFSFSGCKTYEPYASINMYGNDMYFSPRPIEAVQVFHNKPPGRFMEIGEITVERAFSLERAKDVLRRKAADIGGDAIYIVDVLVIPESRPHSVGFSYGHQYGYNHGYSYGYNRDYDFEYTVTGVIIRYSR